MKYEILLDVTHDVDGKTLKRVRRVKDGHIGGWVESQFNLDQDGGCFVYDDAAVHGEARVSGDAKIFGKARVRGHSTVTENARVSGSSIIDGTAKVLGNARVYGVAVIQGNATVGGSTVVRGRSLVEGDIAHDKGDLWNVGRVKKVKPEPKPKPKPVQPDPDVEIRVLPRPVRVDPPEEVEDRHTRRGIEWGMFSVGFVITTASLIALWRRLSGS